MDIPTEENEESLVERGFPERPTRYAGDDAWTPVRDGGEHFHRYQPRRDRSEGQLQWAPLVAAAAAGFLVATFFGPCQRTDLQREQELASLQSELQGAKDRVSQLESQLSGAFGAGENTEKADASEQPVSEPEPQTAPAPSPPEPKREAPQAAKETETPAAATPAPIASPSEAPSRTEPERLALADSQGAVSVYEVPDPAAPTIRSSSQSGKASIAAPQVLAPERAGWTTQAQPTLYWHASEGIQFPGEFTLTREGEDEPLLRARLTAPDEAGIQRIELSQANVSLDEGASYRWTVSFADPAHSGSVLATGGIHRVAPPKTLRAISESSVPERLDALERAGLWYDALDLVTRSIEDNSGARNLVARRSAMLSRVGIHLPSS